MRKLPLAAITVLLTTAGVARAQSDLSSYFHRAPPPVFAGTYYAATGIFVPGPGELDPGLGTGNEIFNNTFDLGWFIDITALGVVVIDDGKVPDTSLVPSGQDEFQLTRMEIGYFARGNPVDIRIGLYDAYTPCDDLAAAGVPVAQIDLTGLPGGGTAHIVLVDLTGMGICMRGTGGPAFSAGLGYSFEVLNPEVAFKAGPLLAGNAQPCPPGDGTFYQNPIVGCDGLGSGSGLGDTGILFFENFGCFFTDRLVSLHCALESDFSGDCPGGNTYGPLTPNSAGSGAILSATTTPTPSTITLMASGCPTVPPDLFGVFFYGFAAQQSPFGCGNQLVRSPITRLDPPVPLSATGTAERFVDLSLEPGVCAGPGIPTYFQFWYRDPANLGQGECADVFNLSNGLFIDWQ